MRKIRADQHLKVASWQEIELAAKVLAIDAVFLLACESIDAVAVTMPHRGGDLGGDVFIERHAENALEFDIAEVAAGHLSFGLGFVERRLASVDHDCPAGHISPKEGALRTLEHFDRIEIEQVETGGAVSGDEHIIDHDGYRLANTNLRERVARTSDGDRRAVLAEGGHQKVRGQS